MDLNVPGSYVQTAGRFDELVDASGAVRPHWESMVRTWATLGAGEIVRRQTVAERLLVAEGAGHVFHDDREVGVSWGLDPVPYVIGATEWRDIERGLSQRTRVLDAVLDDLYGARRLLLDGVIPTAAVMGSRAYQFAAVGVATRRPRLVLYAADLVRDSGGRWLLLRDHTDAPTGCGYALMNRTVLSRLYPEPFQYPGVTPAVGSPTSGRPSRPSLLLMSPGPHASCSTKTRRSLGSSRPAFPPLTSAITWPAAEISSPAAAVSGCERSAGSNRSTSSSAGSPTPARIRSNYDPPDWVA